MGNAAAKRERSLWKGLAAGLIGGLAGAGVKMLVEKMVPPRSFGSRTPPETLAEQIAGHHLPEGQRHAAGNAIRAGFGAAAGAVYGAMVEEEPTIGAWRGAAFGVALNKMTHESLLPKMGLTSLKEAQPARERVSHWVSHAFYGLATEAVRRAVRRVL